jgi:hypothetical protein
MWPNVPCPPGQHITTAADMLDYIIARAIAAKPPNLSQIISLATTCKANAHPPPPIQDPHHCLYVERAKFFTDAGDWFRVADELEHP